MRVVLCRTVGRVRGARCAFQGRSGQRRERVEGRIVRSVARSMSTGFN